MQLNLLPNRLYNTLKKKKIVLVYLPLVIYWIILFVATSIPIAVVPQIFNAQDKFEHLAAYFILSVLFYFTLHFQLRNKFLNKNAVIATVAVIALYGAFDEIHQYFIPGRFCDALDWSADLAGGIIGVISVNRFLKKASADHK